MNELATKQMTLESREVAKMVAKGHNDLLKDIRQYIAYLTEGNFPHSEFYQESNYKDTTGRTLPSFTITKKGCEFIAHKLTGQKGTVFTATYINKFHEMEQCKKPIIATDKALDREIRLKNAKVREANIFLKIADAKDTEPIYRGILKAKAVEVVAGERLLPYPSVVEKTYTATEIAEMYNISSANMVGKICNKLNLKADEGQHNEFGRWMHNKSQHSSREVKSWVYTELGAERIRDFATGQLLQV